MTYWMSIWHNTYLDIMLFTFHHHVILWFLAIKHVIWSQRLNFKLKFNQWVNICKLRICIVYNVFKVNNVYGVFFRTYQVVSMILTYLKLVYFISLLHHRCFRTTLAEVIKMYCLIPDVQFVAHSVSLTLF